MQQLKPVLRRAICLGAILCLALLWGCAAKYPFSPNSFQTAMQGQNYSLTDVTASYAGSAQITAAWQAQSPDSAYSFTFLQLSSAQEAILYYDGLRGAFLQQSQQAFWKTEDNSITCARFTQTTTQRFMFVSRVENTLLTGDIPAECRTQLLQLLQTLGY